MKLKNLSESDLKTLEMCRATLDTCEGVSGTVSTFDRSWLGIQGDAFIMSKIDREVADLIWDMAGMSKDDPKSAYNDVMTSADLKLYVTVFKIGGLFSSAFLANASIMFESKQVKFGCCAEKSIPQLVDRLRMLLMVEKPLDDSTAEALGTL